MNSRRRNLRSRKGRMLWGGSPARRNHFSKHTKTWCDSFPPTLPGEMLSVAGSSPPPRVFFLLTFSTRGLASMAPDFFFSVGMCSETRPLTASAVCSPVSHEHLPRRLLPSGGDGPISTPLSVVLAASVGPLMKPRAFGHRTPSSSLASLSDLAIFAINCSFYYSLSCTYLFRAIDLLSVSYIFQNWSPPRTRKNAWNASGVSACVQWFSRLSFYSTRQHFGS